MARFASLDIKWKIEDHFYMFSEHYENVVSIRQARAYRRNKFLDGIVKARYTFS
jgi:hypothetical protein